MSGEQEAYDKAYSLVRNRRFDDALDAFKQLLVDFPDSKYTPNSYYWVGELYQVITPQDLEAARQAFTQLLERYPDHAKVPDAMYKLGKVHFLKGNRDKSRDYLEQVIAKYSSGSNSSTADKARQFLNTNF
jgi:tol-pal system protein YbgF